VGVIEGVCDGVPSRGEATGGLVMRGSLELFALMQEQSWRGGLSAEVLAISASCVLLLRTCDGEQHANVGNGRGVYIRSSFNYRKALRIVTFLLRPWTVPTRTPCASPLSSQMIESKDSDLNV
jgi:hypothetical protein